MLIAEINAVVEKYKKEFFTGHLKFGIENSKIVSFTELSKCEKSDFVNADFQKQLIEHCTDLIYGSVEFDLVMGEIKRLHYCKSFNGENLRKKLGTI